MDLEQAHDRHISQYNFKVFEKMYTVFKENQNNSDTLLKHLKVIEIFFLFIEISTATLQINF